MKHKRKFLVILICLLIPCFTLLISCGQSKLKYNFTTYSDNCIIEKNTILLNKYVASGNPGIYETSASTYFNEKDKNLDWDGSMKEISFELDLSPMRENDLTIFILGFNEKVNVGSDDEVYDYVDDIKFSILKSGDKFLVKEAIGANSINLNNSLALETDRIAALNTSLNFTSNIVKASFIVSYNETNNELKYKIIVGEQLVTDKTRVEMNFQINRNSSKKIEGFRYLWNARTTVDGIKLSNLDIKNAAL